MNFECAKCLPGPAILTLTALVTDMNSIQAGCWEIICFKGHLCTRFRSCLIAGNLQASVPAEGPVQGGVGVNFQVGFLERYMNWGCCGAPCWKCCQLKPCSSDIAPTLQSCFSPVSAKLFGLQMGCQGFPCSQWPVKSSWALHDVKAWRIAI